MGQSNRKPKQQVPNDASESKIIMKVSFRKNNYVINFDEIPHRLHNIRTKDICRIYLEKPKSHVLFCSLSLKKLNKGVDIFLRAGYRIVKYMFTIDYSGAQYVLMVHSDYLDPIGPPPDLEAL